MSHVLTLASGAGPGSFCHAHGAIRRPAVFVFNEGSDMRDDAVGRPMEILMIEDSLMFARVTIGALRKGNLEHRMTWLTHGEDGLDFLYRRGRFARAPRPDLILLDLGLPKMDGREVLAKIRSDGDLDSIPVVVMTASTSHEDMLHAQRLNVESYMTKPVDLDKFIMLVKELQLFWHEDVILPA